MQAYTNAAFVSLSINGATPLRTVAAVLNWADFGSVRYMAGNVSASAHACADTDRCPALATHTVATATTATTLVLRLDAPNASAGTGAAVVLDGQDVALVRVEVRDAAGRLVRDSSSHNVSVAVVSGPGRVLAVSNGDAASHEPMRAPWRPAYHGLVRAIIGVTVDCASSTAHRRRLLQIDVDGNRRTHIHDPADGKCVTAPIVVAASAPSLPTTHISIPVSLDLSHGPVSGASQGLQRAYIPSLMHAE